MHLFTFLLPIKRWKEFFLTLLFSLVISALPFYKVLFFSDRALLYRDIGRHFLAGKALWATQVIKFGEIPYWNFFAFGGMRFWAENVNSPLHPLNFIFLLVSPENISLAMNYFIWIHYVFLFLGGFYLGKSLKGFYLQSLLLGILFSLSGTSLSAHNITHSLISFTSAPWFWAFLIGYMKTRKKSNLILASICLAWPIYGGDPQFTFILGLSGCMYLFIKKGKQKRFFFDFLCLTVLSISFAAAQFLPTLEFALESARGFGNLSVQELQYFSFHPIRLLETIWPQFFGNQYGLNPFWGEKFVNFIYPSPFIFSTYAGALIVPIYVFSVIKLISGFTSVPKHIKWIHCLIILSALLCFGEFSPVPLYRWAIEYIPLFQAFRYPERLLFWLNFLLFLICFLEINSFIEGAMNKKWRSLSFLVFSFFIFLDFLAIFLGLLSVVEIPKASIQSIFISAIFLMLYFLIIKLFAYVQISKERIFLFICILLSFELVLIQKNLVWDQSKNIIDSRRYLLAVTMLDKLKNIAPSSVEARRFTSMYLGAYQFLPAYMDHTTYTTFGAFESLVPNIPEMYGVEDISGYYALILNDKEEFWRAFQSRGYEGFEQMLNVSGVRFRPIREDYQKIVLEESDHALPYLSLAKSVQSVTHFKDALKKVSAEGFDPKSTLIIESKESIKLTSLSIKQATMEILKRTGRVLSLSFNGKKNDEESVVLWNESYDSHWHAYLKEKPLRVFRANAWAMAVRIPKEYVSGVLEFRYENPLITIGKWITGLTFLGFFIYLGWLLGLRAKKELM